MKHKQSKAQCGSRTVQHWLPAGVAAALLAAGSAWAGIELERTYVTPGEPIPGRVVWTNGVRGELELLADVQVQVPATAGARPAVSTLQPVCRQAVDGRTPVAFAFKPDDALVGRVRFVARLLSDRRVVLEEHTDWVAIGVRQRLDLAGDWTVAAIRPFPVTRDGKPPFVPATNPATLRLPGTLPSTPLTAAFRGWVTVRRVLEWPAGGLAPGLLVAEGVADSLCVRVGGKVVAELLPETELDSFLSHWPYYHGERLYSTLKGREDSRRLVQLLHDRDLLPPLEAPLPPSRSNRMEIELELRGTSGIFRQAPAYGIHGALYAERLPAAHIYAITFDTAKPDAQSRFTFTLDMANSSDKPFRGRLRTVYGQYAGAVPYSGACPATGETEQEVTVPAGGGKVVVERREDPRFATCRASFVLLDGQRVVDASGVDYHTVTVEIRDRRDLYVNNEKFYVKGRGSFDSTPNQRWQLLVNGTNMRRGMNSGPSPRFPGLHGRAAWVDAVYAEGLLHDTGPLVASCEKCAFWNPDDTGNIRRAVWSHVRTLWNCPGIIQWEATNELFGETAATRAAIGDAFREMDPYHRPVVMTKGGGEWEAEAEEGRVVGPDIVGVQYLGTREAIDALTSSITEQPIQSTEINWNDSTLIGDALWEYGLDRGICGALLFDYSGRSTDQPVPGLPPAKSDGSLIARPHRAMYQDLVCEARQENGSIIVRVANRMPYAVRDLRLRVADGGEHGPDDLAPGAGLELGLPATAAQRGEGQPKPFVLLQATYTTHGGLPHVAVLSEEIK